MFSIVHFSDPHFGVEGDLEKVDATMGLVPDLEPQLIVVTGDLTVRARHGEFQAARVWIHELERTAPVYVLPGDHDVQWWRRPFLPTGRAAIYRNYRRHFGPVLAPTMRFQEAVVTGIITAHGLAWPSLTPQFREWTITGHLPHREVERAKAVFSEAAPEQARILVMHHNVLRGERSERMGLVRWKQAHRMLIDSGADAVLCGHDHQEKADVMGGVVVSCAGTLSSKVWDGQHASFHRIVLDGGTINLETYRWEPDQRIFRRTDAHGFAGRRVTDDTVLTAGVV